LNLQGINVIKKSLLPRLGIEPRFFHTPSSCFTIELMYIMKNCSMQIKKKTVDRLHSLEITIMLTAAFNVNYRSLFKNMNSGTGGST
jgi:hypothetical protein